MTTLEDAIKAACKEHIYTFNFSLFAADSVLTPQDITQQLRIHLPNILRMKYKSKYTLFPLIVIYQLLCKTPMVIDGSGAPFQMVVNALSTLSESHMITTKALIIFLQDSEEKKELAKKTTLCKSKITFEQFVQMILDSRQQHDMDIHDHLMDRVTSDFSAASAAQAADAAMFDFTGDFTKVKSSAVPSSVPSSVSSPDDLMVEQAKILKTEMHHTPQVLKNRGFTAIQLLKAGYSQADVGSAYTLSEMKDANDKLAFHGPYLSPATTATASLLGGKSRRRRHSIKKSKSKLKSKSKSKSKSRYNKVRKTRRYRK